MRTRRLHTYSWFFVPMVFSAYLMLVPMITQAVPEEALFLTTIQPNASHVGVARLYAWADMLEDIWSIFVEGTVLSASLRDLDDDGSPELVVVTGVVMWQSGREAGSVGRHSFLMFDDVDGEYVLVFNETGSRYLHEESKPQVIDYFGNGTDCLIAQFDGDLIVLSYREGRAIIRDRLPGGIGGSFSLCVGDANNDGLLDILFDLRRGIVVLENQGRGEYARREASGIGPGVVDEIRVGDVDGDGMNEIVMVGCCPPNPSLSVWGYGDEGYRELWSHYGGIIQSVDLGDLDGDGVDEIVTSAEASSGAEMGVSIWKYRPGIV